MARSAASPSPSPVSPSPSASSSIDPASPGSASVDLPAATPAADTGDTATCLWDECGQVFAHLPTLISHIHNDHIGVHKSNYTCEWATCPRRALAQTSRFALISHMRSHTGEKPFTCLRPECDKSFTRSDALAKHMRLQHHASPPPAGRGRARRRKAMSPSHAQTPPAAPRATTPTPAGAGAFTTFKLEPNAPAMPAPRARSPSPPSSSSDGLPPHLARAVSPGGRLLGRRPALVRYLLVKAKHRYALEQHEQLIEELRVARAALRRARADKERALDGVLRAVFGPQAEALMEPEGGPFMRYEDD